MALEHILEAIRKDAKAEVAEMKRANKHACKAILAEAAERAEAVAREVEERLDKKLARERRKLEREQERRAAKAQHAHRARQLDALFGALDDRLSRLRDEPERHQRITRKLLEEAFAMLPEAKVLLVDPRDAAFIGKLASGARIVPELATWGGVVLDDESGRRVDNTLEARRRARRDELLVLVGRQAERSGAA